MLTIVVGNSLHYTVPINFLVSAVPKLDIVVGTTLAEHTRLELTSTRLITLTNIQEAVAEPAIIFNAVLIYHIQ